LTLTASTSRANCAPPGGSRHPPLSVLYCVRRAKARFSSGCESRPATFVPAGSNRSGRGGNEAAEASGVEGHVSDLASTQAVTRVNGPAKADGERGKDPNVPSAGRGVRFSEIRRYAAKTRRPYLAAWPSRKSIRRMTETVHIKTGRSMEWLDAEEMVKCLNQKLGGWATYFKLDPITKPTGS
jgi:Group II intron, maturase-specific domain